MSSPGVVIDGFDAVAESSQDTTIGVISQHSGNVAIGHLHTYPTVEELQDDGYSDIESVTTPLNPDTTDANATGNYSPNSPRDELELLKLIAGLELHSQRQKTVRSLAYRRTFLGIISQAALAMLTVSVSGSTSFSQNANILFWSAAACNLIGFLFCLFSILVSGRRTGVAPRIVTGTGFVFTAYGFLAIMGMLLSDNIMLWVTGLACIASSPALASGFIKEVEEQPLFNRPRLPETFLGITSQAALTTLTIWTSGGSTSFSQNAKILFWSAAACNVTSFLLCLFSILLSGRKTGVADRIVTGTGFVFTAYGFLAIMGMLLSDNIMLWVTGMACIASFPALASGFIKVVEEQPLFNRPRLPETLLGITSQAALTALTIWTSGGSTSFSQNAKILFWSAAACNVISFLLCLFSILLSGRKTGVAHRIVTGTGFVFTAYGFLAIMGMLLSDNIMLWVTGLACIASFPALASEFSILWLES